MFLMLLCWNQTTRCLLLKSCLNYKMLLLAHFFLFVKNFQQNQSFTFEEDFSSKMDLKLNFFLKSFKHIFFYFILSSDSRKRRGHLWISTVTKKLFNISPKHFDHRFPIRLNSNFQSQFIVVSNCTRKERDCDLFYQW